MPRIITPQGEVKYYETEAELEEAWGGFNIQTPDVEETDSSTQQEGDTTSTTTTTIEEPKDEKFVSGREKFTEADSWGPEEWKEGTVNNVKTVLSAAARIPDMVTRGVQLDAQTKSTLQLASGLGVDTQALALSRLFMKPETRDQLDKAYGIGKYAEQEQERLRIGKAYALEGLQVPGKDGKLKPLGIDPETPVVGMFGRGGALYEAVKPEGEINNLISDVGAVMLMTMGTTGWLGFKRPPNVTSIQGLNKLRKFKYFKGGVVQPWRMRAGLRKGSIFGEAFKTSNKVAWQNFIESTKRIAPDLAIDFLEDATLYAKPDIGEARSEQLREYLANASEEEIRAFRGIIEANDDATAQYWNEYLIRLGSGTAMQGILRLQFAAANRGIRLYKLRKAKSPNLKFDKFVESKEYQTAVKPYLEQLAEVQEKATQNLQTRVNSISTEAFNKEFTTQYRDAIGTLNSKVAELGSIRGALRKATTDADVLNREIEDLSRLPDEDYARFNALPKIIKSKQEALTRVQKANNRALKQGYTLTKAQKSKLTRAQNELNRVVTEQEGLKALIDTRVEGAEERATRAGEFDSQADALSQLQREKIEAFVEEIDTVFKNLEELDNNRFETAPDLDLSGDPYHQSYLRIRDLLREYSTSKADGVEDKLLDGITAEYRFLQQNAGGSSPIKLPPLEGAGKEQPDPNKPGFTGALIEGSVAKKQVEGVVEVAPEIRKLDPVSFKDIEQKRTSITGDKTPAGKALREEIRTWARTFGRKYDEALDAWASPNTEYYKEVMEATSKVLGKTDARKLNPHELAFTYEAAQTIAKSLKGTRSLEQIFTDLLKGEKGLGEGVGQYFKQEIQLFPINKQDVPKRVPPEDLELQNLRGYKAVLEKRNAPGDAETIKEIDQKITVEEQKPKGGPDDDDTPPTSGGEREQLVAEFKALVANEPPKPPENKRFVEGSEVEVGGSKEFPLRRKTMTPEWSAYRQWELKYDEITSKIDALDAKTAPEGGSGVPKAPDSPEGAPGGAEGPTGRLGDDWEDVVPLDVQDGKLVPDPDKTGDDIFSTVDTPLTAAQKVRQEQINLGESINQGGEIRSSIDTDLGKWTSEEAGADFANRAQIAEEAAKNGTPVDDQWVADGIRAVNRTIGKLDTAEKRAAAVVDIFTKQYGQPEGYLKKGLINAMRAAGKLGGVNPGEYVKFYKMVTAQLLRGEKDITGLKKTIVTMLARPAFMYAQAARLYDAADNIAQAIDSGNTFDLPIKRKLAAEEAWMLYQAVGQWLELRTLSSNLLYSQSAKMQDRVLGTFRRAQAKRTKAEKLAELKNSIEEVKNLYDEFNEQLGPELPKYIGLPSNLSNVQETLNKFSDTNFQPTEADIAVFDKIINQLAIAGSNPDALSNIRITGDEIVGRLIRGAQLSNPATQTSFMGQTGVYGAAHFWNQLTTGRINALLNNIPWFRDDEALQAALQETKLAKTYWRVNSQMAGNFLQDVYKTRQFNKSVLNGAAANLDSKTKFGIDERPSDPIREAAQLKVLNDKTPLGNTAYDKALYILFGDKAVQKRNNFLLDWMNLRDMVFLGDAYDALGKNIDTEKQWTGGNFWGKAKQKRYDFSPTGIRDRYILEPMTKGLGDYAITPRKSQLPGGERVGGTFPLVASETSTEVIGGLYAQLHSKAKAWHQALEELDPSGRPLFAEGSPEHVDRANVLWKEQYTTPVTVGIGKNSFEIARAVKDGDSVQIAHGLDMMMATEDDFWGGTTRLFRMSHRNMDGTANVVGQRMFPFLRNPINAHKHHWYFSQPMAIPGLPGAPFIPNGVFIEGAIGAQRMIQSWDGTIMGRKFGNKFALQEGQKLSDRFLFINSKIHHKDPKVRAQARSALVNSTVLNWGVLTLVEQGAIEVTGGQSQSYREANGAYVPPYHVKIPARLNPISDTDFWVPYRWIPYVGEFLGFAANYRDFSRFNNRYLGESTLGAALVAGASTLLDQPTFSGMDHLISAIRDPHKAEEIFVDYLESITGAGNVNFWTAVQRLTTEAYAARQTAYGSRASVLFRGDVPQRGLDVGDQDYPEVFQEIGTGVIGSQEEFRAMIENIRQGGTQLPSAVTSLFSTTANRMGLLPIVETMDQVTSDNLGKMPGDFRQAHWYKPGDITYLGPKQKGFFQSMFSRHMPVPHEDDELDKEIFRHGVRPPTQVFRKFGGMVANPTMVNRFRRFLGTEFVFDNGQTLEDRMREVIEGRKHVPGNPYKFYNDLIDDPKNSLTIDGKAAPWFDRKDVETKRDALMRIRNSAIIIAREQFLMGFKKVLDDKGQEQTIPIELAAPEDAQLLYLEWRRNNIDR